MDRWYKLAIVFSGAARLSSSRWWHASEASGWLLGRCLQPVGWAVRSSPLSPARGAWHLHQSHRCSVDNKIEVRPLKSYGGWGEENRMRRCAYLCNLPLEFILHLFTVFSYFPLSLLFRLPKPCRLSCWIWKRFKIKLQPIQMGKSYPSVFHLHSYLWFPEQFCNDTGTNK